MQVLDSKKKTFLEQGELPEDMGIFDESCIIRTYSVKGLLIDVGVVDNLRIVRIIADDDDETEQLVIMPEKV